MYCGVLKTIVYNQSGWCYQIDYEDGETQEQEFHEVVAILQDQMHLFHRFFEQLHELQSQKKQKQLPAAKDEGRKEEERRTTRKRKRKNNLTVCKDKRARNTNTATKKRSSASAVARRQTRQSNTAAASSGGVGNRNNITARTLQEGRSHAERNRENATVRTQREETPNNNAARPQREENDNNDTRTQQEDSQNNTAARSRPRPRRHPQHMIGRATTPLRRYVTAAVATPAQNDTNSSIASVATPAISIGIKEEEEADGAETLSISEETVDMEPEPNTMFEDSPYWRQPPARRFPRHHMTPSNPPFEVVALQEYAAPNGDPEEEDAESIVDEVSLPDNLLNGAGNQDAPADTSLAIDKEEETEPISDESALPISRLTVPADQVTPVELQTLKQHVEADNWKVISELIRKKPSLALVKFARLHGGPKATVLHFAISNHSSTSSLGHLEQLMHQIISKIPTAATILNGLRCLPLHVACTGQPIKFDSTSRQSLILKLIKAFPEALATKGGMEERTPLHTMVIRGK